MKPQANHSNKAKSFKVSDQVKAELQKLGILQHFNFADYKDFKKECKGAFNIANAIAEKFIQEYKDQSDFNTYLF